MRSLFGNGFDFWENQIPTQKIGLTLTGTLVGSVWEHKFLLTDFGLRKMAVAFKDLLISDIPATKITTLVPKDTVFLRKKNIFFFKFCLILPGLKTVGFKSQDLKLTETPVPSQSPPWLKVIKISD